MPVVEVRFRVRETGEFKKALNDNKKEADAVLDKIKQAGKQVGSNLVLSLRDARKVVNDLGGDTKRFESAVRQAGVSIRDAKVLTQQLNKELNASRREALGIQEAGKGMAKSLRDGAFAAEAMHRVFDKAKEKLKDLMELGKVKGLKEATADAMELQKQFDKLQAKLVLTQDPKQFASVRKAIEDTSIMHNIPQSTLVEAVLQAEESKSAGRELTLSGGGGLLKQLSKTAYGDYMEPAEMSSYIKSQVVQMKDLGLTTPEELAEMQGITRAGEQAGALSAKDIALKGGKIIAQLAGLRGTQKIPAYREGQAVLQTIGDAPGISGDVDVAVNRAENLVAKLADPKTRERIKEMTGINVMTKEGRMRPMATLMSEFAVSQKGGKFKIPETDEDLRIAEQDPKKKSLYKDFFEMFHDMQAREGFLAVYKGREKLRKLEGVDAAAGTAIIEQGYQARMGTMEGQLTQRQMRDELTHAQTLNEKFGYIRAAAEVTGQMGAKHPVLSEGIGMAGAIAGKAGPTAQAVVEAGLGGIAMGATGMNLEHPREQMQVNEHNQSMADSAERNRLAKYQIANLEKQIEETKRKLEDAQVQAKMQGVDLRVQVNVQSGQTATVTAEAKKTKAASQSGTRHPKKNGQH
jgi:hypothetical protein